LFPQKKQTQSDADPIHDEYIMVSASARSAIWW